MNIPTVGILVLLAMLAASSAHGSRDDYALHPKCRWLPFSTTSWITQTSSGELLRFESGGLRRSSDSGVTWSDSEPASLPKGTTLWGGEGLVMVSTKSGALVLLYMDRASFKWGWDAKTNSPIPEARLDVWACRSLDGGKTWIDAAKILDGYCGALIDIKQLSTGRIVATLQDLMRDQARHYIFTVVSDDDGKTWQRGNTIDLGGRGDHDGALEPTLAELSDGRVLMLIRTNHDQFWAAYSDTHGLYWRDIRPSGLDASSAPGHLLRLASGRLALVWNRLYPEGKQDAQRLKAHSTMSETPASWHRSELSVSFSGDDGKTWSEPVVVVRAIKGRLSYPYLLEHEPGELWVISRYPEGGPVCFALKESDFVRKHKMKLMK